MKKIIIIIIAFVVIGVAYFFLVKEKPALSEMQLTETVSTEEFALTKTAEDSPWEILESGEIDHKRNVYEGKALISGTYEFADGPNVMGGSVFYLSPDKSFQDRLPSGDRVLQLPNSFIAALVPEGACQVSGVAEVEITKIKIPASDIPALVTIEGSLMAATSTKVVSGASCDSI